ncbi:hypothetical protein [Pseudomonas sp. M30-35]|uniref:hypothetical protein n=1 Tax=Pseudomonas sp. M30-35 TaxID=1981174 RepID=UPI000B3C4B02|nr:hypothetical protein [Pseudomonas sp. M30-35]ARU87846.1 hypothetical protein B9K09_07645 [Pseudomonas sp. M30-35]
MSEYSYGWEKLHVSIHALAGPGTQSERLVNAVVFNLIHIDSGVDLPPSIRDEFEEFISYISSGEPKGEEGTVEAKVNTFSDFDLKLAVERIISFYDQVCRYMEPS